MGVVPPEAAFAPRVFLTALAHRGLEVRESEVARSTVEVSR